MSRGALHPLEVHEREPFEQDIIQISSANLLITFIGHGSHMLQFMGKLLHVDPFSKLADDAKLLKTDIVFIAHEHADHLDPAAIQNIRTKDTVLLFTAKCAEKILERLLYNTVKSGRCRESRLRLSRSIT